MLYCHTKIIEVITAVNVRKLKSVFHVVGTTIKMQKIFGFTEVLG